MSPINVSHPLVFIGQIDCAGQVFAYMPDVSLRSNSPPQPPMHESLYEIGVSRAASHIDDRADKVGFIILVYRRDRTEPPCLPGKKLEPPKRCHEQASVTSAPLRAASMAEIVPAIPEPMTRTRGRVSVPTHLWHIGVGVMGMLR